jgi:hypothetical protein
VRLGIGEVFGSRLDLTEEPMRSDAHEGLVRRGAKDKRVGAAAAARLVDVLVVA